MKNGLVSWVRTAAGIVTLCLLSHMVTAQVSVLTYHNDNSRSGANSHETLLTPATVNTASFGKLATFAVQGSVYAQPLYVPNLKIGGINHNVVFVVTEHDQAYAFDINTGRQLWEANYLASHYNYITITPIPGVYVHCGDIGAEIGITGTPVIDLAAKTMFLVTNTMEYNRNTSTTSYYQTIHAVDITSGQDKVPPQIVTATAAGNGTGSVAGILTFDPLAEGQRAALALVRGQLIITWASHCDAGNFHGWMIAYDETSLTQTSALVDTPNGYEGGFWASGSGPAIDLSGSMYFGTGNGGFDVDAGGNDYGDSVLKLVMSRGTLTVADYFSPWDQQTLDANDKDLGSGGVMLLPDQLGKPYPHLLIQAGKEGTIDLLNRDNLGKYNPAGDTQIVQTLPYAVGAVFGSPAYWNNNIYFGGRGDHVKAFAFNPQTQLLSPNPTSVTTETFSFPGVIPSVSSNGTTNGILWIVETDHYGGGKAVLRAYDATNLQTELYNSAQNLTRDDPGPAIKFSVPVIADGHVFVGSYGLVSMYGLISQRNPQGAAKN